jgi:hypothetical protein
LSSVEKLSFVLLQIINRLITQHLQDFDFELLPRVLERKEKEDLRLKTAFEVNGIKIKQNVLDRTKLLVDRL